VAEFLAFQEYKLRRQNGLAELDSACCCTLYGYLQRLCNVNRWFANKPWKNLDRGDLQRVYDGLEDGEIRTRRGARFEDRRSYYNKIFKGKPFRMAGKDHLAREVIEFSTAARKPVRFVTEETFRRLCGAVHNPVHLLLLWLAWDIGENICALLQLTADDLIPQNNRYTREREYLVSLHRATLKRSRTVRSELTLYPETVRYADIVLGQHRPDRRLFRFGYQRAVKILFRARDRSAAATMPGGEPLRWKDLRSGMACHLLRYGWTCDEVNARLGHTPRSAALDAYINFLALDRDRLKQRLSSGPAAAREEVVLASLERTRLELDRLRALVERALPAGA
jgi:hypothetical protein